MKARQNLVQYMNDSRYVLRQRDSIHYKEPNVEFDPVHIDVLFEDFRAFCESTKRKPLTKDELIECLSQMQFNEVVIDRNTGMVSGICLLADSSERDITVSAHAVPQKEMIRFLGKVAEVTGDSRDHVIRSNLYDLFTEYIGSPKYSRQSFYKSLMNLSFNTIRYPLTPGFAKGGVHCIRGIRLKVAADEL